MHVVFLLLLALAACAQPPSPDTALAGIATLQAAVFPDGPTASAVPDTTDAYPFVRAVQDFAEAYPEHPRTAPLLMDAAGLANGTGWTNKAFQLWGQVWRKHPDYARAAEALFYQGFVADTQFNAGDMAVTYYTRLIESYPDTEYARQAVGLRQIASGERSLPPVPEPPTGSSN